MNTKLFFSLFVIIILGFTACETGPGEGGTSTIRGKVIVHEYNGDFTIPRDTFPAAKEDVYIIYGDDYVYGDKFETSYDGSYEFNYLREGSYKVYAYSDDSSDLIVTKQVAIIEQVEVTGKNQIVEVPDIIILK
jgi:hypothetical protein